MANQKHKECHEKKTSNGTFTRLVHACLKKNLSHQIVVLEDTGDFVCVCVCVFSFPGPGADLL